MKGSKAKITLVDEVISTLNISALLAGGSVYGLDVELGMLQAGDHTIRIVADADGELSESNDSDNEYTLTITVVPSQTVVDDAEAASKIRIYPNPFTDNLMIELNGISGPADVEIYNASGLKVLSDRFTQRILLPCAGLKPGIYLVRICDGNSVYWRKTIRE